MAVYETAVDSPGPPSILLGTPGFQDVQVFVRDDGKIMRFSGATIFIWGDLKFQKWYVRTMWLPLLVIRHLSNIHGHYVPLVDSRTQSQATVMHGLPRTH